MMSKSDLVDIEISRHAETDDAFLVSLTGKKDDAVWVPKSQVEMERRPRALGLLTLPEWFAIDKGLV